MSVIGRLDEQVNEVLIAPLDRNRQPTTEASERPLDEQPGPLHNSRKTPGEDDHKPGERATREDLPVWLL